MYIVSTVKIFQKKKIESKPIISKKEIINIPSSNKTNRDTRSKSTKIRDNITTTTSKNILNIIKK